MKDGDKTRKQLPDKRPETEIGAAYENNERGFRINDNGIGIGPEETERIFRIFQRVPSAAGRPGSGIGLAKCKKIDEKHGGRIWVESKPGSGSTFLLPFPNPRQAGLPHMFSKGILTPGTE